MKKLLFLVLLIKVATCFSQNDTVNYFPYYNRYIDIENEIVSENFHEADSLFASLFCDYDPPFLSDVLVALQISVLANNIEHTIDLLNLSVKKGATLTCLKELRKLESLPISAWESLYVNYDYLRKQYFIKIDTIIMNEITRRYQNEQELKKTDLGWLIVEENAFFIKKVIREKGNYPGEKMIGVNKTGLHNQDDCGFVSNTTSTTLLHYSFGYTEFESYLLKALRTGYIHPREFARNYIQERIYRKEKYGDYAKSYIAKPKFPKYRFNFIFSYYYSDIEQVDHDRAAFGICSYETDKKKLDIENKCDIRLFFYPY